MVAKKFGSVWLMLFCLANLDTTRADVRFELILGNLEFLHEQFKELKDFVRTNTETTKHQLETQIAQLTADIRKNLETTKQQDELKTSLLTNAVEKNHVSVLSQIAQQQQKIVQLTREIRNNSLSAKQQVEMKTSQLTNAIEKNHLKISQLTELMETKSRATQKQVEMKLVNLTDTVSRNEKLLSGIKTSTSDILHFVEIPCKARNTLCISNSHGADWIVVQQRIDLYSTSFNRSWSEYREGFGSIGESLSFWLGLERLYQLTMNNKYELLVEVTNEAGEMRFARYSQFKIGSEAEKYKLLELSGFSGTAQDANSFSFGYVPTGLMFSTYDSDNDQWSSNCASGWGGGWWWNQCGYNINYSGSDAKDASWYSWSRGSMKSTRMSIRERK